MKTLRLEFSKMKRKKIGLTMCALMGIQFLWLLWITSAPKEQELAQGWLGILYDLPLLNAILIPTYIAVLASRLSDIEHKGNTYKQLRTLRDAKTLFNAKVLCGFLFILLMVTAQFAYLILLGHSLGYAGSPEVKYYAAAFVLNLACCFSLYLLQLALSMLIFNQMIPLVTGLCGSMLSVVLMFVETYSFLPWGGFLSSALVRMEWNPDTKIITYSYRDYSAIELCAVGTIFVWIAVFYFVGRRLFIRKEV